MLETTLTGNYKEAIIVMSPVLEQIIHHYRGWGKSEGIDKAEYPEIEINDFLGQLDIFYPGASKRKLKLAIRTFITNLSCFKYRIIANMQGQVVAWNPLEEPYTVFINKHRNDEISYRDNTHPHPVADLISDWVTKNISENIYTN
ncbi:MAG: hypothetical protein KGV56_04980 [Gammaproteobacteria bacterium]|nr:hypothetical protein [Gammaproteobacteria bacterium]